MLLNLNGIQLSAVVIGLNKNGETLLAQQIADGKLVPDFGEVVTFAVTQQDPALKPYADVAKANHTVEGEVEIDEYERGFAMVSKADDGDGAYVMAWVWVSDEELADAD